MTQEASSIQDLNRVFVRAAKDIAYHLEHHVKPTIQSGVPVSEIDCQICRKMFGVEQL